MKKTYWLLIGFFMLLSMSFVVSALDTGWLSPTNEGDTYSEWGNPTYAYADDSSYATGTNNNNDQDYYGYDVEIPEGNDVIGIEVSSYLVLDSGSGTFSVRVTFNDFVSYTQIGSEPISTGTFTYGNSTNLVGLEYTDDNELSVDNFRVYCITGSKTSLLVEIDYVFVKIYYTPSNQPPVISGVWLDSKDERIRQIDYYYANFSAIAQDGEGDTMNITIYALHGSSYFSYYNYYNVTNGTFYYNVSIADFNFTALNTVFTWGIIADDGMAISDTNETFTWKRILSPMPDFDYLDINDWIIIGNKNNTDLSLNSVYIRNESNNYTFANAKSNSIIYTNILYFNRTYSFWNYTSSIKGNCDTFIKKYNDKTDYWYWFNVPSGGSSECENYTFESFVNHTYNYDNLEWANFTYNITVDCDGESFLLNDYDFVFGLINCSGGNCSGWYNYTDDNVTVNVSLSVPTLSYEISEDNWLYVSGLSLDPSLMLFVFIGFFYYFATKKRSNTLYFLTVAISLIAGVYYLGWEVDATSRILGIALILFSIYCSYEAVASGMSLKK